MLRSVCYDARVNGKFIDRATKWAKASGRDWRVDASRGKGGHKLLFVGDCRTVVQTHEVPTGTFHAMLKQLAIPREEF